MSLPLSSLKAAGLGAILALGAASAEAQRPLEIEDLFDLRQVGTAVVQPGGDHVAYVLVEPRDRKVRRSSPCHSSPPKL